MRILLVTQYFWPENFRINELATQLRERGHEITVFTGLPNYPSGKIFPGYGFCRRLREDYRGIPVIRFPHLPRGDRGFLGMAANFVSFALLGSLLAPFLLRGRPFDVIFVYEPSPITVGFPAVVMRALRKIPLVFWVQDLWPESLTSAGNIRSPWILKPVERMVRFLYRRFDRILAQSRGFFPWIMKWGVPASKLEFYPLSAEKLFHPTEVSLDAPQRKVMPRGFTVLFAGNIGESQDFPTILATAELLKDSGIHWVILGSGRAEDWVRQEIPRRGLEGSVHLLGRFPLESMPVFFSLADVLLISLKKEPIFSATLPSKLQSYMAMGKPILASLDGECARILREAGGGLSAAPSSPPSLAEAARRLAALPKEELAAMGQRSLEYYRKHFDPDSLLQKLETIFEQEMERRQS